MGHDAASRDGDAGRNGRRRVSLAVTLVLALGAVAVERWWHRRPVPLAVPPPTRPSLVVPLSMPLPVVAQRVADAASPLEPERGRVTLRVVDGVTGAPLPQAWIALPVPLVAAREDVEEETVAYEARGYAENPVVVESYWTRLFVVAGCDEGYLPATTDVLLGPHDPDVEVTVALSRCGELELRARGGVDGVPVSGVALVVDRSLRDPSIEELFTVVTTRVSVSGAPPDDRAPLFPSLPARSEVDAQPPGPIGFEEAIRRLAATDGEGWQSRQFEAREGRRFVSVRDGHARLSLPPGEQYSVVFWPDGPYSHALRDGVVISDRATECVELMAAAANVVRGRVLFADDTPARGAHVAVYTGSDSEHHDPVPLDQQVDALGEFVLPIARRQFLVLASLDRERDGTVGVGYGAHEFVPFDESSGATKTLEMRFTRRERDDAGRPDCMRGRVFTPDGTPAVGASVHAGVFGPRAFTDGDGRFVLFGGLWALSYAAAAHDREAMATTLPFILVATWDSRSSDGASRATLGRTAFTLAELDPTREFEVRCRE